MSAGEPVVQLEKVPEKKLRKNRKLIARRKLQEKYEEKIYLKIKAEEGAYFPLLL